MNDETHPSDQPTPTPPFAVRPATDRFTATEVARVDALLRLRRQLDGSHPDASRPGVNEGGLPGLRRPCLPGTVGIDR